VPDTSLPEWRDKNLSGRGFSARIQQVGMAGRSSVVLPNA
jgi:hypothetical protein